MGFGMGAQHGSFELFNHNRCVSLDGLSIIRNPQKDTKMVKLRCLSQDGAIIGAR